MIRVIVADDQEAVRTAFEARLQEWFEVVPGVSTATLAVQALQDGGFDVMLTELHWRDSGSILPVLPQMSALGHSTAIVILTGHERWPACEAAISTGARGFVCKSASWEEIRTAVEVAARGGVFVCSIVREYCGRAGSVTRARFTDHQVEIIRLLAEGYTHRAIASRRTVCLKTVGFHVTRIRRELGLQPTQQADWKDVLLCLGSE